MISHAPNSIGDMKNIVGGEIKFRTQIIASLGLDHLVYAV